MHVSENKGTMGNTRKKDSFKLSEYKIIPKNIAPKKVLPASPINNLEGYQLNNKNAIRLPTKPQIKELPLFCKALNEKIITIHELSSPSIPSAKFEKFIIEVAKNEKKKYMKITKNKF